MATKALICILSLTVVVAGLKYDSDRGDRLIDDRVLMYAVPDYRRKQEYISSKPDEIKLCGPNLGDAIFIICGGNKVVGEEKSKRNLNLLAPLLLNKMAPYHDIEFNDLDDGYRYKWPWSMMKRQKNYESRLKRVLQDDDGVANLCCDQPCSYDTLLSFCKTGMNSKRN